MGDYFYDSVGQRKARFEDADVNGNKARLQIIELFQQQKYYEINLDTGACTTGNLSMPFIPHDVPSNANFTGDFIVGSSAVPDGSVEIQTWVAQFNHNGQTIDWFGEFTSTGCIPVRMQVFSPNNFMLVEDFVDIVIGIPDPNAFIPPASCGNN
jgi:hypothetical protein